MKTHLMSLYFKHESSLMQNLNIIVKIMVRQMYAKYDWIWNIDFCDL